MGEAFNTEEIFELKDKWGKFLRLHLVSDEYSKQRILEIEGEHSDFEITKPLARKIVKELTEEFKLKQDGASK